MTRGRYLSIDWLNLLANTSPKKPHIHFIGIGGIGMSALALILVKRGYSVSGSDQNTNNSLENLTSQGITVFTSQRAINITNISRNRTKSPLIIVSTAIPKTNPELRAAKNAGLEILHRSDLLAYLIRNQPSIVVSGSHGKTTTSTIITTLLALSNNDPTAVIGGVVPFYKSNGHAGKGKFIVAEADESDGTITKFKSEIGLITNIELDHTNYYSNIESLIQTMKRFARNSKIILANYDCKKIREKIYPTKWWSNQTIKGIDFAAIPISMNGKETIVNFHEKEVFIKQIKIPLPGHHNLSNVTGAISACRLAGIPFEKLEPCLENIQPPDRRFQFRGIWNQRQIVDDYAHHPSEIKATLSMVQLIMNSKISKLPQRPKRVVSVFQPHRFSRTKDFLNDFAKSLEQSDEIILAPIYDAGEAPILGINSQALAKCINKIKPSLKVSVAQNFDEVIQLIKKNTTQGDLILNIGAGNINNIWEKLQDSKPLLNTIPSIIQAA